MQKYSQLTSNRGVFTSPGLPNVELNISSFSLPAIAIPVAQSPTTLTDIKEPATKADFEPLDITFILDEDMKTWFEIYSWMNRIAPFKSLDSYSYDERFFDGTIIINNSNNNPIMRIKFYNMFPTNLSPVEFTEEDSEAVIKTCNVTFEYFYYEVEIIG
jgi:hypothetical protein